MKIFNLVKVIFDRRRADITQEWLDYRYQFFVDNTLRSLQRQTFIGRDGLTSWKLWLCFGAGMQDMISNLLTLLYKESVPYICTFAMDDPVSVDNPYMDDETRKELEGCDYVYISRIDSDDLYSLDALEIINKVTPKVMGQTEACLFRRGYIHDVRDLSLSVYSNSSSPFHTLMVPREVFLDRDRYGTLGYGDHSKVTQTFPYQYLPDWKFTVLIHDKNFLSTMNYSSERDVFVEKKFSIQRFLTRPVVFDVDDFSDQWNCLPELDLLKKRYPEFRCTAFAIPNKCSRTLLKEVELRGDWLDIAPHGINHEPNEEMKYIRPQALAGFYKNLDFDLWTRGFRPPGWYLNSDVIRVCNELGMWVALHYRDRKEYGYQCKHGYYACEDRLPYWHAHSHDVCGNGIQTDLKMLLSRWPVQQEFSFVSDAIVIPQWSR